MVSQTRNAVREPIARDFRRSKLNVVELLVRKMIRDKIVSRPYDPPLRKQEFTIEDWQALPEALG